MVGAANVRQRAEQGFGDHLFAMWLHRRAIVVVAAGAALLGYLLGGGGPVIPRAASTVQIIVNRPSGQLAEETSFVSESYARLAATAVVLDGAAALSGLGISGGEAGSRLVVVPSTPPGYLDVTAQGPTEQEAVALADGAARAIAAAVDADENRSAAAAAAPALAELADVQARLAGLGPDDPARTALEASRNATLARLAEARSARGVLSTVVEPAHPTTPIAPAPLSSAIMAALVGLVLAAEGSVVARKLSGRLSLVNPAGQVADLLGLGGAVALTDAPARRGPTDGRAPAPVSASPGRAGLTAYFQRVLSRHPVLTVLEEPGRPAGRGAVLLSEVAGSLGRLTLIVDAALGAPTIDERLELQRAPGLAELLEHRAAILDVAQRPGTGGDVVVLTAGHSDQAAAGLLAGGALPNLVRTVGADTTIISVHGGTAPGIVELVIASAPSAVVLCIDAVSTTVRRVRELADQVAASGGRLIGVVLTTAPPRRPLRNTLRRLDDTVRKYRPAPPVPAREPVVPPEREPALIVTGMARSASSPSPSSTPGSTFGSTSSPPAEGSAGGAGLQAVRRPRPGNGAGRPMREDRPLLSDWARLLNGSTADGEVHHSDG